MHARRKLRIKSFGLDKPSARRPHTLANTELAGFTRFLREVLRQLSIPTKILDRADVNGAFGPEATHEHFVSVRALDDKVVMDAVISVHSLHDVDIPNRKAADAARLAHLAQISRRVFSVPLRSSEGGARHRMSG